MGYIVVIAWLPGIYGNVNCPCPWALPSESGRFTGINPWPHAITITYFYAKFLEEIRQCSLNLGGGANQFSTDGPNFSKTLVWEGSFL